VLKRNLSILMIACGLLGAHVSLAAANQTAFPGTDAASEAAPVKVSYLEKRAAGDTYASATASRDCTELSDSQGSTESPFPVDNSRD